MLGSVTEAALTIMLRGKTMPTMNSSDRRAVFDFNGPLGTFSSKILLAYAFNFIGPETRSDLDLIRLIKSRFAHSRKPFDFSEPTIKPITDGIKSPDWPGAFIPHGYLNVAPDDQPPNLTDKAHPKTRYVSACHVISERLLDHSPIVEEHHRLKDTRPFVTIALSPRAR